MDRKPLPPPFPVGTRLRYLGTSRIFAGDAPNMPLEWPGMEVTVTRVKLGRQGTLRLIEVDEYSGEEIQDTTRDGYSLWERPDGSGRIIWPANTHEWEIIV